MLIDKINEFWSYYININNLRKKLSQITALLYTTYYIIDYNIGNIVSNYIYGNIIHRIFMDCPNH